MAETEKQKSMYPLPEGWSWKPEGEEHTFKINKPYATGDLNVSNLFEEVFPIYYGPNWKEIQKQKIANAKSLRDSMIAFKMPKVSPPEGDRPTANDITNLSKLGLVPQGATHRRVFNMPIMDYYPPGGEAVPTVIHESGNMNHIPGIGLSLVPGSGLGGLFTVLGTSGATADDYPLMQGVTNPYVFKPDVRFEDMPPEPSVVRSSETYNKIDFARSPWGAGVPGDWVGGPWKSPGGKSYGGWISENKSGLLHEGLHALEWLSAKEEAKKTNTEHLMGQRLGDSSYPGMGPEGKYISSGQLSPVEDAQIRKLAEVVQNVRNFSGPEYTYKLGVRPFDDKTASYWSHPLEATVRAAEAIRALATMRSVGDSGWEMIPGNELTTYERNPSDLVMNPEDWDRLFPRFIEYLETQSATQPTTRGYHGSGWTPEKAKAILEGKGVDGSLYEYMKWRSPSLMETKPKGLPETMTA